MCRQIFPGFALIAGFIEEYIAKAPSQYTLHARNPARNLVFGGRHINFASVASAPNVSDRDGGRRVGNFADYCKLVQLAQSLNIVPSFGWLSGGTPWICRRRHVI